MANQEFVRNNPKFMILEAAPERYINTVSATVVVLIRALEAFVAFQVFMKAGAYLLGLFSHGFETISLSELLRTIFPEELLRAVSDGGRYAMWEFFGTGDLERLLVVALAVCILAVMAFIMIEAVMLIILRFAMTGADIAKTMRRLIRIMVIVLLIIAAGMIALIFYHYFTDGDLLSGVRQLQNMQLEGVNQLVTGVEQLRGMIILSAVCIALLGLRAGYHKNIYIILSAVAFEIRIRFKETQMAETALPKFLWIFGAVSLVAAVLFGINLGFTSLLFFGMVIEVVKYIMMGDCWSNFHRCHI